MAVQQLIETEIITGATTVSRQSNVDQSCNFLRDSYLPYLVILLPVEL